MTRLDFSQNVWKSIVCSRFVKRFTIAKADILMILSWSVQSFGTLCVVLYSPVQSLVYSE